MTSTGPNPIRVAWSMLRAQATRRPRPTGHEAVDHSGLAPILGALRSGGAGVLVGLRRDIAAYRSHLESVIPDELSETEALAYWLNLYNAGALDLAAEAWQATAPTVLRVPGGFERPWATVAGERLSLDAIEHGKVRRLGDPRIHGALVCGSASCPTLRYEPYDGARVDDQLDDQMRSFLRDGGAVADREEGTLLLSRILRWYGADFVRPHRMPAWLPARTHRVLTAITPWLDDTVAAWVAAARPAVAYQPYDWALACAVG
jgi:hypothetical protein